MNQDRYYPAQFDRRHEISGVLDLRLGRGWTFSAAGTFGTGQPYTRPGHQYILYDSPYMGHNHDIFVSNVNTYRLPAYRRLDVGLAREGRWTDRISYDLRLQVVNLLGLRNLWFYLYTYDETYAVQEDAFAQISVPLPNLSLSVSF